MSDISKHPGNLNKRRIHEIDETIEHLSNEVQKLNDFVFKTELESSLMTAKLKREKVKALAAVAKSQVILADMDILIAESDLYADLVRMKNRKKLKLDRDDVNKGRTQQTLRASQDKPASTSKCKSTKSTTLQTTTSSTQKKKTKPSSSKLQSPVDIFSDDTVIVESLPESKSASVNGSPLSSFNNILQNQQARNVSDSEISLSSSIKAEFENPYTKTDAEVSNASMSNKKIDSTSKPSHRSSSIKTKSVSDINRSVNTTINSSTDVNKSQSQGTPKSRQSHRMVPYEKKLAPSTSTYIPMRHNMPMIITQPKTINALVTTSSMISPGLYVNATGTQANMYQSPNMNSQSYTFYGTQHQ